MIAWAHFLRKKKLIKLFFDSKIDFPRFFYFWGIQRGRGAVRVWLSERLTN